MKWNRIRILGQNWGLHFRFSKRNFGSASGVLCEPKCEPRDVHYSFWQLQTSFGNVLIRCRGFFKIPFANATVSTRAIEVHSNSDARACRSCVCLVCKYERSYNSALFGGCTFLVRLLLWLELREHSALRAQNRPILREYEKAKVSHFLGRGSYSPKLLIKHVCRLASAISIGRHRLPFNSQN